MKSKYFRPMSEWSLKELEESISVTKNFLLKRESVALKDYLAKLLVERTSRIGKNK